MTQLLKNTDPLEVSAEELRVNLADYLNQVRYADRVVVVKKYDRDAAIIVSPRMFKRIVESGAASREDRREAMRELKAILSRIPTSDPSTLDEDVNEAIAEVRAAKRKKKQA